MGGNVWAGTDDGMLIVVARLNADSTVRENIGAGITDLSGGTVAGAVRALATVGDTLWVGSASGLSMAVPIEGGWMNTRSLPREPLWLRAPVVALVRSDTAMLVMTRERAGIVDLRTRAVSDLPGNPDLSRFGPLISAAVDARTIWIGAERGAVVIDRASGVVRSAAVAGAMSERVFDIALEPGFAWLATPSGLVRLQRLSDGGIR